MKDGTKKKIGPFTFAWWEDEYSNDRSRWYFKDYPNKLNPHAGKEWTQENLLECVEQMAADWADAAKELREFWLRANAQKESQERAADEAEFTRLAKKLGKKVRIN